jgi:hypothetical protein
MAVQTGPSSNPPNGYFSVWQRLLRGYGPLAVFAVLLLLMAVLVPSKSQNDTVSASDSGNYAAGSSGRGSNSSSGDAGGTGTTVAAGAAGGDAQAGGGGGAAQPGAQGGGGGQAAPAKGCPDRKEQVPGDPYTPPCIAFSGNNGGATSKGVTDKEIHVAFRVLNEKGFQQTLAELAGASLSDSPDDIKRTVSALAEFFNKRYQFYGRKIVIDFYNGVGSNTNELLGGGRDKAEADAETVAKRIGAFADMSATSEPYADALARRGIVGFGDPYLSTKWHDGHRPYIWSLAVDGTTVAKLAAEYTVKRLYGPGGKVLPAKWAGGSLKDKPRKLASMAPENSWYQESVQVAKADVESAGIKVADNIEYQLDLGTMSNQAANLIPKLKSEGITTILCGCDPVMPVFLTGEMNRQGYFPEIVVVGTALTDTDIVGQLWNQNAAKHALGVSSLEKPVPPSQTIAYEAYKTVRNDEPAFSVDLIYYQMQMMAIGIQMAGPNLNPQTFEQGMFSYPGRLGPAGYWSFKPHDYTAADDVREIYWDPDAVSTYNGKKGAYVDPQEGTRWLAGKIPAGEPKVPVR